MPSRLSRPPAASMIRCLVACLCAFPYRAMRASTSKEPLTYRLPPLYYDRNSKVKEVANDNSQAGSARDGRVLGDREGSIARARRSRFRGSRNEPEGIGC